MGFDKSLYASQIQQLQQLLEIQFNKNIAFFQRKSPEIAKKFARYDAQEVVLRLSDEGYLNLFNQTLDNKPVYSYDPQQFCQDFIDEYAKKPMFLSSKSKKAKVLDEDNVVHVSVGNRCIDLLADHPQRMSGSPLESSTNMLLLNGIGMGYLIPQILEVTDVRNIIIIEPHNDIFHASLHILDWEQVYAHFEQAEHSLLLVVGESPNNSMEKIRRHLNLIGMHNAINPFVIDHLSSKEMKEMTSAFLEKIRVYMISMGYFDDEQVGLAHTIENWRRQTPPLRKYSPLEKELREYPIFIVGNGPSLDHAKEFLQNNHKKAIIVSCGTTIGSLNKLGITPDFHIEMERTRPVIEWLKESTDEDYRRDVILLALNTVHPEVFELFEHSGMGMKANDLGTHFFSQYITDGSYAINLAFCNPTVGNAGLAFAIAMGFKDIYLFGLDLGFSAGDQHHSSLSTHYRIKDEHVKSLHLYSKEDKGNTEYAANFGGKVTTTAVYMNARLSFEELIKKHPYLNCYNTSHGILIDGAKPTPLKDITLTDNIVDKATLSLDLFKSHFYTEDIRHIDSQKQINQMFAPVITTLDNLATLMQKPLADWDEAQLLLNQQHRIVLSLGFNDETQYAYSLLKGSIFSFNMLLNRALYCGSDRAESLELYNKVRRLFIEFLIRCKEKTHQSLFQTDTKTRELASKLGDK